MFILKILFLLFIAFLVMVVATGVRIFGSVRKFRNQFRDAQQGFNGTTGRRSPGDDTIIDRRSAEEANRKIIPKDEGEYVEFEEV